MKRLLPLLVLAGCRTTAAPIAAAEPGASAPTRVPDEAPSSEQTRSSGGFVVFGMSDSIIVPVDPLADVQMYPHWFIGDGEGGGRVRVPLELVESSEAPALKLPYCADAIEDASCGRMEDGYVDAMAVLQPRGAKLEVVGPDGSACECVTVEGVSDDGEERYLEALLEGYGLTEEDLGYTDFGIEEFIEVCYEDRRELMLVSIAGGVAHSHDMVSSLDCGELNIYSLESRSEEQRQNTGWEPFDVDESFECSGMFELTGPLSQLEEDIGCRYGEDDCCPDAGEGLAHRIVSGVVVQYAGDVSPVGEECGCIKTIPATPETCGPFDPCGSTDGLPGLKGTMAWWAASDGSAGLGLTEAGDVQVFIAGEETFVRGEELGIELGDVYGVEYLPVVPSSEPPLVDALVVELPTTDETPAKSWGNLCFKHFKEGELDAAEAACYQGLLENLGSGDDNARGALLYSMGRVEEARGRGGRARLYYERSLKLRPGNAAVQKRLSAL